MTDWSDLRRELDAWTAAGRTAEFWWRDDDAVAVTPALERLVALQRQQGASLALAVIPARADAGLAARLRGEGGIAVVQHGWAHVNHARPGRAKAELGPERDPAFVLGELCRGAIRLDALFGERWLKVLVPPHNRIAPAVAAGLAAAGYAGLSTDKPRQGILPLLVRVNTHIDIMEWSSTRAFRGESACLAAAIGHLAGKRSGTYDAGEPTGLLTHHLAHDEAAWAFAARFLEATRTHPAAAWRDPRDVFAGHP